MGAATLQMKQSQQLHIQQGGIQVSASQQQGVFFNQQQQQNASSDTYTVSQSQTINFTPQPNRANAVPPQAPPTTHVPHQQHLLQQQQMIRMHQQQSLHWSVFLEKFFQELKIIIIFFVGNLQQSFSALDATATDANATASTTTA